MSFKLPDPFDKHRDEQAITRRMAVVKAQVNDLLGAGCEVYAVDEVRLEHEAETRRMWLPKGQRTKFYRLRRCLAIVSAATHRYRPWSLLRFTSRDTTDTSRPIRRAISRNEQPSSSPFAIAARSTTVNTRRPAPTPPASTVVTTPWHHPRAATSSAPAPECLNGARSLRPGK
nr:hypothetical protein [Propionibacterium australiense]